MPNNEIEEATIVDPENDTDELSKRLKMATEPKKAVSNSGTDWSFDVDENAEPEPVELKTNDFEPETPKEGLPGKTDKPNDFKAEPKLSKDLKEASARITVSALDSTQRMIFTPLINKKYEKKFTKTEVERLSENNLIDEEKSRLSVEDLPLRNKFDRLMKKRDKKIKDIPFTDQESGDLEKIFYQYMDVKNKTLPPEISLLIGISNVVGKRAIDLFTD